MTYIRVCMLETSACCVLLLKVHLAPVLCSVLTRPKHYSRIYTQEIMQLCMHTNTTRKTCEGSEGFGNFTVWVKCGFLGPTHFPPVFFSVLGPDFELVSDQRGPSLK